MTDRHAGYIVVLEKDLREDDAEGIRIALGMISGVQQVVPVTAEPSAQWIAVARRDAQWREKLSELGMTMAADG